LNSLPGYDNWKLASPPERVTVCQCGHEQEDHLPNNGPCTIRLSRNELCRCRRYIESDPKDDGPDPDRAYDEAREEVLR
jgi:hypothetical protein